MKVAKRSLGSLLAGVLMTGAAALSAACMQEDCPAGSRGCPCADSGGCETTALTCTDNVCIQAGTNGTGGTQSTSSGGSQGVAGSGNGGTSTSGGAGGTGPMREEGPVVECPFTALDGSAILIEELGNPQNQSTGMIAPWTVPLQFGTRGGLLKAGQITCTPATATEDANADCSEGYDCGGCLMVWTMWNENGTQSFYLVPDDWSVAACAPLAAFYGVYPGSEAPVHACDLEYPQGCLCADGEAISMHKGAVSMDGIFCKLEDETDPRNDSGTNDWCSHRYVCGTGANACDAYVSIQIDRATGEETFSLGTLCPLVPSGDVYQSASCPDYSASASACSACIDACSGVPECYCTAECETPDYSCTQ